MPASRPRMRRWSDDQSVSLATKAKDLWRAGSMRPAFASTAAVATTSGLSYLACGVLVAISQLLTHPAPDHWPVVAVIAAAIGLGGASIISRGARVPQWLHQAMIVASTVICTMAAHFAGGTLGLAFTGLFLLCGQLCFMVFTVRAAIANLVLLQAAAALVLTGLHLDWHVIAMQQGTQLVLVGVTGWLVRSASIADRDALTGLLNRRGLDRAMTVALAGAASTGGPLCIVMFDFDDFKLVNDTRGHAAGDRLLRDVCDAWRGEIRDGQTLARLGGDEFALVLPGCGLDRAVEVANLMRGLAFEAGNTRSSAGVGQWQPGDSASLLLGRTDAALYDAKKSGRNQTAQSGGAELERVELLRGLKAGEFELFYQPVVAMSDGRQTGAEALLRWRHAERGLLEPADFIPAAERTGAICEIGAWVLTRACADIAALIRATGKPFRVAVNASGVELVQSDYPGRVQAALLASGLPAAALVIEVTESSLDADASQVITALQTLRVLGVGVAIDGFGSGYSSLSRLDRLPANIIKVDRSFVWAISAEREENPILTAIVSLARATGMESFAGGIETQVQADTLRRLGFKSGQGFLYGHPAPMLLSSQLGAA